LSELTGINKETLRHWAEWGLIRRVKDESNGYHYYDMQSFSDVLLFKFFNQIGLSAKEQLKLRNFSNKDELTNLYRNARTKLNIKIEELKKSLSLVNLLETNMQKAFLYDGKIKKSKPSFSVVCPFNIKQDMVFPWEFTTVIDMQNNVKGHGKAGIHAANKSIKPVWALNPRAEYFYFLVSRTVLGGSPSLDEKILSIKNMGYETGLIILRYLTTIPEGSLNYDYFEVWAEANKKS
jgi:DNA-binding transcriptional MerR regulator